MISCPDISVVIATYNRASILPTALQSILNQDSTDATYEVVLVDNNSTDNTPEVAGSFITQAKGRLRYILEARQGVSYARNAAIERSRAPIIAFFDDDVQVAPNWIATIKRTFSQYPDVDCIGGKVLPLWQVNRPAWLTRAHWAPLALQDYGDEITVVDFNNPRCLISANLAVRRAALNEVGIFRPELQRVKDGIGSMEDLELLMRLWSAGKRTMYVPDLIAQTPVPAERLNKSYHRRWHRGNGHFYAMLRSPEMERSSAGRLLDIPAHLYRQAIQASLSWLKKTILRDPSSAFYFETKLQYSLGFARTRRRSYLLGKRQGNAVTTISSTKAQ